MTISTKDRHGPRLPAGTAPQRKGGAVNLKGRPQFQEGRVRLQP